MKRNAKLDRGISAIGEKTATTASAEISRPKMDLM